MLVRSQVPIVALLGPGRTTASDDIEDPLLGADGSSSSVATRWSLIVVWIVVMASWFWMEHIIGARHVPIGHKGVQHLGFNDQGALAPFGDFVVELGEKFVDIVWTAGEEFETNISKPVEFSEHGSSGSPSSDGYLCESGKYWCRFSSSVKPKSTKVAPYTHALDALTWSDPTTCMKDPLVVASTTGSDASKCCTTIIQKERDAQEESDEDGDGDVSGTGKGDKGALPCSICFQFPDKCSTKRAIYCAFHQKSGSASWKEMALVIWNVLTAVAFLGALVAASNPYTSTCITTAWIKMMCEALKVARWFFILTISIYFWLVIVWDTLNNVVAVQVTCLGAGDVSWMYSRVQLFTLVATLGLLVIDYTSS